MAYIAQPGAVHTVGVHILEIAELHAMVVGIHVTLAAFILKQKF